MIRTDYIYMFDKRIVPDFFYTITFDNGITAEFNEESQISFYGVDGDESILRIDPSDLSTLHSAYRTMVKERIEEERWGRSE